MLRKEKLKHKVTAVELHLVHAMVYTNIRVLYNIFAGTVAIYKVYMGHKI